jgi:hypothetical protein
MKRLKPFFGYYGSKWRLASRYPQPELATIVEPFAGSANYALLHHEKQVLLCDLDDNITKCWRYLITATEREILALPDIDDHIDKYDLPEGAKILIGFWLGRGLAWPNRQPNSWCLNPKYRTGCQFWGDGIRQRIASQLQYIRHWRVVQQSYDQLPDIEATWFVDPPYSNAAGKKYRKGNQGIDFSALSSWCRTRRGQVIVCENEGADWLPFKTLTTHSGTRKQSVEVIWSK